MSDTPRTDAEAFPLANGVTTPARSLQEATATPIAQSAPATHSEGTTAFSGPTPDDACKLIEAALRSYRLRGVVDEDDNGMQLVDALTPPGSASIAPGEAEIVALAEHLFDELPPFAERTSGVSVPPGWKLVPVEPTAKMLSGAATELDRIPITCPSKDAEYLHTLYRAMIVAAPQPLPNQFTSEPKP